MQVHDATGLIYDTGSISTGSSFFNYNFTDLECPVKICVLAPLSGTAWVLKAQGCGFDYEESGGQVVEVCWEAEACTDPTMDLTVTGSTGTIDWCGETWVLPGDSGDEKEVCPQSYRKHVAAGYGPPKDWQHRWAHDGLHMQTDYLWTLNWWASIQLSVKGKIDRRRWAGGSYGSATTYEEWITHTLSVLGSGIARPSFSNQFLQDAVTEGSVDIDNITYAWSKGTGW